MKMVRSILGKKRKVDAETGEKEPWISWVKGATAEAREKMKAHKVSEWVKIVAERQEKWKARLENQDPQKWAKQVCEWIPIGFRSVGRPAKRWKGSDAEPDKED